MSEELRNPHQKQCKFSNRWYKSNATYFIWIWLRIFCGFELKFYSEGYIWFLLNFLAPQWFPKSKKDHLYFQNWKSVFYYVIFQHKCYGENESSFTKHLLIYQKIRFLIGKLNSKGFKTCSRFSLTQVCSMACLELCWLTVMQYIHVAEPSEITRFRRRSSSTRH